MGGVVLLQKVVQRHIRLLAVVVVGVDDGKGLVQDVAAGQHRLAGAPGFGAACGQGGARRQVVQRLVGVGHLHAQAGADLLDAVADDLAERLLNVAADDKDDLVKAGLDGVVDGVVHQDLAVGAHRRQLLDAAAVAGADAGRHNDQCCFHSSIPPGLPAGGSFFFLYCCIFLPYAPAVAPGRGKAAAGACSRRAGHII